MAHARATIGVHWPGFAVASATKYQDRVQVISDWTEIIWKVQDPGHWERVKWGNCGHASAGWARLDKVSAPNGIHVDWFLWWGGLS